MTSPYTPPSSPLRDQPRPPGSALKAVAFGLLADIGGTLTGGTVLSVIYGIQMTNAGATQTQVNAALASPSEWSWYYILSTIMGFGCSILGGYVCERIARRGHYNLGLVLGGLSIMLGIVLGWENYSLTAHLFLATIGLASVLLGVRLAMGKS